MKSAKDVFADMQRRREMRERVKAVRKRLMPPEECLCAWLTEEDSQIPGMHHLSECSRFQPPKGLIP